MLFQDFKCYVSHTVLFLCSNWYLMVNNKMQQKIILIILHNINDYTTFKVSILNYVHEKLFHKTCPIHHKIHGGCSNDRVFEDLSIVIRNNVHRKKEHFTALIWIYQNTNTHTRPPKKQNHRVIICCHAYSCVLLRHP